MNKEQLLLKAKRLVNTRPIKGYSAKPLKDAANNDMVLFEKYLMNIADQAMDPLSAKLTNDTYTKDLVDIALLLSSTSNSINEQKIKGGKADNLSVDDIAKKFDIKPSKVKKELNMGIKVELEHTKNKETAKEIAMDHLSEIPDYYTRLSKMEKDGNSDWVNESIKPLIKRLLHENLKVNNASTLLLDFGYLISNNLSQVTKMGKDEESTKELNLMMKNLRAPIINGLNYFDTIKDVNAIIRNPKMLSAVLSKIREFLIYIEPRIQRFVVDNEYKKNWLGKIQRLKDLYKSII